MWARCGCLTTQKNHVLKDFFISVFSENICLQQPQVPKISWELGSRKICICWKKLKLHLLFCGCNHGCKMQCNMITIGLFISILSQHQQKQLVSFLHSLLKKPNMNHQFPTLRMKSEYWETVHMFPQWEKRLDIIINQESMSWQFQKLWKGFDNEEVFCLLLLFPFISCYCYPLFIIHVANSSPEASEQTDFWIRGMLQSELFNIFWHKSLVLISGTLY